MEKSRLITGLLVAAAGLLKSGIPFSRSYTIQGMTFLLLGLSYLVYTLKPHIYTRLLLSASMLAAGIYWFQYGFEVIGMLLVICAPLLLSMGDHSPAK